MSRLKEVQRSTMLQWCVVLLPLLGHAQSASQWFPVRLSALNYPALARQAAIQGTVRLRITVDSSGTVTAVRLVSGNSVLSKAAQINIREWKFAPRNKGASSGLGELEFTYVFELNGDSTESAPAGFVYEYPDKITVTTKALHWLPGRADQEVRK